MLSRAVISQRQIPDSVEFHDLGEVKRLRRTYQDGKELQDRLAALEVGHRQPVLRALDVRPGPGHLPEATAGPRRLQHPKKKTIVNDEAAARMLHRPMRSPWRL